MDSIAVTKSDMGSLSKEQLTQATFGALCQSFAVQILSRSGYEDGMYQRVALEFLEDDRQTRPAGVENVFNIDLSLVLETIRKETREQKLLKKETEKLLERVLTLRWQAEDNSLSRKLSSVERYYLLQPQQARISHQYFSVNTPIHFAAGTRNTPLSAADIRSAALRAGEKVRRMGGTGETGGTAARTAFSPTPRVGNDRQAISGKAAQGLPGDMGSRAAGFAGTARKGSDVFAPRADEKTNVSPATREQRQPDFRRANHPAAETEYRSGGDEAKPQQQAGAGREMAEAIAKAVEKRVAETVSGTAAAKRETSSAASDAAAAASASEGTREIAPARESAAAAVPPARTERKESAGDVPIARRDRGDHRGQDAPIRTIRTPEHGKSGEELPSGVPANPKTQETVGRDIRTVIEHTTTGGRDESVPLGQDAHSHKGHFPGEELSFRTEEEPDGTPHRASAIEPANLKTQEIVGRDIRTVIEHTTTGGREEIVPLGQDAHSHKGLFAGEELSFRTEEEPDGTPYRASAVEPANPKTQEIVGRDIRTVIEHTATGGRDENVPLGQDTHSQKGHFPGEELSFRTEKEPDGTPRRASAIDSANLKTQEIVGRDIRTVIEHTTAGGRDESVPLGQDAHFLKGLFPGEELSFRTEEEPDGTPRRASAVEPANPKTQEIVGRDIRTVIEHTATGGRDESVPLGQDAHFPKGHFSGEELNFRTEEKPDGTPRRASAIEPVNLKTQETVGRDIRTVIEHTTTGGRNESVPLGQDAHFPKGHFSGEELNFRTEEKPDGAPRRASAIDSANLKAQEIVSRDIRTVIEHTTTGGRDESVPLGQDAHSHKGFFPGEELSFRMEEEPDGTPRRASAIDSANLKTQETVGRDIRTVIEHTTTGGRDESVPHRQDAHPHKGHFPGEELSFRMEEEPDGTPRRASASDPANLKAQETVGRDIRTVIEHTTTRGQDESVPLGQDAHSYKGHFPGEELSFRTEEEPDGTPRRASAADTPGISLPERNARKRDIRTVGDKIGASGSGRDIRTGVTAPATQEAAAASRRAADGEQGNRSPVADDPFAVPGMGIAQPTSQNTWLQQVFVSELTEADLRFLTEAQRSRFRANTARTDSERPAVRIGETDSERPAVRVGEEAEDLVRPAAAPPGEYAPGVGKQLETVHRDIRSVSEPESGEVSHQDADLLRLFANDLTEADLAFLSENQRARLAENAARQQETGRTAKKTEPFPRSGNKPFAAEAPAVPYGDMVHRPARQDAAAQPQASAAQGGAEDRKQAAPAVGRSQTPPQSRRLMPGADIRTIRGQWGGGRSVSTPGAVRTADGQAEDAVMRTARYGVAEPPEMHLPTVPAGEPAGSLPLPGMPRPAGTSSSEAARVREMAAMPREELTLAPGFSYQQTRQPPDTPDSAKGTEPLQSEYARNLPAWAQDFIRSASAMETTAAGIGNRSGIPPSVRKIGSLSAPEPGAGEIIDWSAPAARAASAVPAVSPYGRTDMTHKEKAASEGVSQQSWRMSESELRRTADKIYNMIEDRIRRERRLLGL